MSKGNSDLHEVQDFFQRVLNHYTDEKHLPLLLEAKEYYFKQTGKVDEDDDDFESRMVDFNEWYILQFIPENRTKTLMREYLKENRVDEELYLAFTQFQQSIFEYLGNSFSGCPSLWNFIEDKKVKLPKNVPMLSVVKGDLFTARLVFYKSQYFLLGGMSIVPKEVKRILKKESKKVRKLGSHVERERFLLRVEGLKTKWKQYGHVDVTKIFQFS